jgi:fucose 4-O-acetylase-like acetyltransferase
MTNQKIIKDSQRRGWIDYARGFVIIYVVYRHAMSGLLNAGIPINNAIYLVQESSMPTFFIVSGIFIYASALKRGLKGFIKLKFETLMYPYFIWAIIQLIIQIYFNQFSNTGKDLGYLIYLITFPRAFDQFWYLFTLFSTMALFAIINFKLIRFKIIPNILIGFIFYVTAYFAVTNQFSVNDILFYYPFLVFGFLMADIMLPAEADFFKGKWLVYFLPAFILLQIVWRFMYPNENQLINVDFIGFVIFMPLTIGTALLLFFFSQKLNEWRKLTIIQYIGSYSLYIYIMHLIFTGLVRSLLVRFFPELPPFAMLIIIMLGGLLFPILSYHALLKLKLGFLFEPPPRLKSLLSFGRTPR